MATRFSKTITACAVVALFGAATLQQAHAFATKCTDEAGLGCRVDAGDILKVNVVVGNNGNDNETNVEAAILTATGSFVDLTLLGKSDGGYGDSESGLSGDWSIPGFASFITVKSANSFNVFAVSPASQTGSWNTNDILNSPNPNSGRRPSQQALSHISYWSASQQPVSTPEPGTLFLMGSGLAGLGLWRWKTKK